MSEDEFEEVVLALREKLPGNRRLSKLVRYARELRALVRQFIDDADRWDEEWPEIGYDPTEGEE